MSSFIYIHLWITLETKNHLFLGVYCKTTRFPLGLVTHHDTVYVKALSVLLFLIASATSAIDSGVSLVSSGRLRRACISSSISSFEFISEVPKTDSKMAVMFTPLSIGLIYYISFNPSSILSTSACRSSRETTLSVVPVPLYLISTKSSRSKPAI